MRIFVDTNIITEYLEERAQADLVDRIFEQSEQKDWERYISVGSFYTITYLTERFLRHQGIVQPQLAQQQCYILTTLLETFNVQDLDKQALIEGVSNLAFLDLEDSYQNQAALRADCDVLLTINKKDFKRIVDEKVIVLTPQEFIDRFQVHYH